MARPHRNLTTSSRFHFINRGIDGQDLFGLDRDWYLFETLIAEMCADTGVLVHAYALMSNHFHVLGDLSAVESPAEVSTALGALQSGYARYFNDRTGRRGPLFEPRFLAFGVDGDVKFARVARYIHANPIDITGQRAIGAYRWSSLPVYLGRRRQPDWMCCEVLGSMIDADRYLADLGGLVVDDLVPIDELPPRRRTTVEQVERAVERSTTALDRFDAPLERRRLIALLAIELRAADVVVLAQRLGITPSTVRRDVRRARLRCVDDGAFARLRTVAMEALLEADRFT